MAQRHGELSGKVAIVTGGARGVGAATAQRLARLGAAVMIADVLPEMEEVVAGIRASGGTAQAVQTDITNQEQVQGMVDRTLGEFGRVDFLLNIAAVLGPTEVVWKADPGKWKQAADIDLVGTFRSCRAVVPHMVAQGSGRVLNVSTLMSFLPTPRGSAYGAAKAGLTHFTRILALELIGTGVTANAVDPGVTQTTMVREYAGAEQQAGGPPQWRPRYHHPSEPAKLLTWLCGPVGSWLNGQFVSIYTPIVRSILQLGPEWHYA